MKTSPKKTIYAQTTSNYAPRCVGLSYKIPNVTKCEKCLRYMNFGRDIDVYVPQRPDKEIFTFKGSNETNSNSIGAQNDKSK